VSSLEEAENGSTHFGKADIIYPACDVDLFATADPIDHLWRAARLGGSISVSTKARIRESILGELKSVAEYLDEQHRCMKIGISISAKLNGLAIEGGAAGYEARLRNLDLLQNAGLSSSLVLRPILNEVSDDEYGVILEEAATRTSRVLLGEEYLDAEPLLRRELQDDLIVATRNVSWLPDIPSWPVASCPDRLLGLSDCAERLGYRVFQSDSDLMSDLLSARDDKELAAVRHYGEPHV